jgi:hypothetical protein
MNKKLMAVPLAAIILAGACAEPNKPQGLASPSAQDDAVDRAAPPDQVQIETEAVEGADAASNIITFCGWPPFCPENYQPISIGCSANCYAFYGYDCFWGHNIVTCAYAPSTPSGSISATPTSVPVPTGGLGTTEVCWDVDNVSTGEVWVSSNGGGESLFARDPHGCQSAPWIQRNNSYAFRLYAGTSHTVRLGSVTVTGVDGGGGSGGSGGPCNACDPGCGTACQSGNDCHCGDFCWPSNYACP